MLILNAILSYFVFESYLATELNRKKDGNVEHGMEKRMTMIITK